LEDGAGLSLGRILDRPPDAGKKGLVAAFFAALAIDMRRQPAYLSAPMKFFIERR
jgi:hypothetical protein